MTLTSGEIWLLKTNGREERWTVSLVDNNLVKLFTPDGYRQMSRRQFDELVSVGLLKREEGQDRNFSGV